MKIPHFSARLLVTTALVAFPFLTSAVQAADINWGSAQGISGESDVSTHGTLIGAFNVGSTGVPATTVNGVNFQSFAAPNANGSVGDFTLTAGFDAGASNTDAGSANAPFTGLTMAYQSLLMSRVGIANPSTLLISGLVAGMQYEFQFWVNSSGDTHGFGTTATTGSTSVNLTDNGDFRDGGLGEFAIGTFTATGATQSIDFTPSEVGTLNGFQLRQIPSGPAGVPDSGATLGLLSLALGGLVILGRQLGRAQAV